MTFRLRELFLLILIVAIALAWCLDHQRTVANVVYWQKEADDWKFMADTAVDTLNEENIKIEFSPEGRHCISVHFPGDRLGPRIVVVRFNSCFR